MFVCLEERARDSNSEVALTVIPEVPRSHRVQLSWSM